MSDPRVAVVVLTYAGLEVVREALIAVDALDYAGRSVFVVDNGSEDATTSALREEFPHVDVLECEVNLGVAGGFNVGLRRVLFGPWKYALLLHHDVEPEQSMLRELVRVAEANPRLAAVGPKIHDFWDRQRVQSAGGFLRSRETPVRWRGGNAIDRGQFDEDQEVDFVSNAAMLLRMDVVRKIGQFDPQFRQYEDADWCLRAAAEGRPTRYCGSAAAWRLTATRRPERVQREFEAGRSAEHLVRRHGSALGRATFLVLNAALAIPAILDRVARGRRSPLARVWGALAAASRGLKDPPMAR